jgi:hypothetical protein
VSRRQDWTNVRSHSSCAKFTVMCVPPTLWYLSTSPQSITAQKINIYVYFCAGLLSCAIEEPKDSEEPTACCYLHSVGMWADVFEIANNNLSRHRPLPVMIFHAPFSGWNSSVFQLHFEPCFLSTLRGIRRRRMLTNTPKLVREVLMPL